MSRPLLLDLFCGAGGAARGYADAGFDIIGVDLEPQPRYPYRFLRGDATDVLRQLACGGVWRDYLPWADVRVVHASPPCQAYSTQTAQRGRHPRLLTEVHDLLAGIGRPWVIENVEAAGRELPGGNRLCGSSFGLDLRRHRLFWTSVPMSWPRCDHSWQTPRFQSLDRSMVVAGKLACVVGVHGNINYSGEFDLRRKAMEIDWMTNAELVEAIPPAYTRHIGDQLAMVIW